jgi:hypothetical protein
MLWTCGRQRSDTARASPCERVLDVCSEIVTMMATAPTIMRIRTDHRFLGGFSGNVIATAWCCRAWSLGRNLASPLPTRCSALISPAAVGDDGRAGKQRPRRLYGRMSSGFKSTAGPKASWSYTGDDGWHA